MHALLIMGSLLVHNIVDPSIAKHHIRRGILVIPTNNY
jgi:hypothetical protein